MFHYLHVETIKKIIDKTHTHTNFVVFGSNETIAFWPLADHIRPSHDKRNITLLQQIIHFFHQIQFSLVSVRMPNSRIYKIETVQLLNPSRLT